MRRLNRFPLLLLITFLAVGAVYALVTPPFEASDEMFHYPFVRNIALGRGLPIQKIEFEQPWEQEGSQPPAYYLLSAALTFWIDTGDYESVAVVNPFARIGIPGTPQNANHTRYPANALVESFPPHGTNLAVRLLRLLSMLMGAGTVALTYLLTLALAPTPLAPGEETGIRAKLYSLLAAAFVALNPMFLFIGTSVNNDNMIWLEAALTLFIANHLVRGPSSFIRREFGDWLWDIAGLGLLLGLAAITKISGLILIPITGVALLMQAIRMRQWRRFFVHGPIIVAIVFLVAGWWYVRNVVLYGELLGIERMAAIAGLRPVSFSVHDLLSEWRSFWYSYWGLFGAFTILASPWVYGFYTLLTFVGVAGLARRLLSAPPPNVWRAASHGLMVVFFFLTVFGLVRWDMLSLASQGRLIFTAIAPLSAYLAIGLLEWVPRLHVRSVVGVLVGALGFIAIFTAAHDIAPKYIPPASIPESQLPFDLRPVRAVLAPGAELIGYTVDSPERLAPGGKLIVTLYWRALATMPADYNLFLHALGRARALAGSVDTWPGGGLRPTSFWKTGEIYKDTYVIDLDPAAAAPSTLWLDVAMWQTDSTQPLPITDASGRSIPSVIVPVNLLDSIEPLAVKPQTPADSTLEGGLSLLGFDLPSTITAGTPSTLTLYWQAADMLAADYTVFVHIRDESGQMIAQADGAPAGGDWPTSAWSQNRPVIDSHVFTIAASGNYSVLVGLYDPSTVVPLVAYRGDGSEWPDRAIELANIVVR